MRVRRAEGEEAAWSRSAAARSAALANWVSDTGGAEGAFATLVPAAALCTLSRVAEGGAAAYRVRLARRRGARAAGRVPWGQVHEVDRAAPGLTSIGEYAFYGCDSLTSLELPASLTNLGDDAFHGCSSMTSIELPAGLTSLGDCVFCDCSSLTSIELPAGLTSIGPYVLDGCSSLTSIALPAGLTSIDECAFKDCSSMTSIGLPASLTSIRWYAFSGCSSLTSIELPAGLPPALSFAPVVLCMVFVEVLSWFAFYSFPIPDQTGHSQASVRRPSLAAPRHRSSCPPAPRASVMAPSQAAPR